MARGRGEGLRRGVYGALAERLLAQRRCFAAILLSLPYSAGAFYYLRTLESFPNATTGAVYRPVALPITEIQCHGNQCVANC